MTTGTLQQNMLVTCQLSALASELEITHVLLEMQTATTY